MDDEPIGSQLSTAEEDAARLASVDQIIYERMQEAERQATEIEQAAFERGFQAGEAEGRAFGESQYRTYIQRLEGELKELAEVTAQVKDQADEQMLALCIAMGEHLAAQQIERGRDSIRALVDRVLENLPFPVPRTRETGRSPSSCTSTPTTSRCWATTTPRPPGVAASRGWGGHAWARASASYSGC